MTISIPNANPQPIQWSRWEAVTITITMKPVLTTPWPGGATFQVNIREMDGTIVLQSTLFTVTDATNGVVELPLTSAQTGIFPATSDPSGGSRDFLYDVWRTDAGSEKRLAWGTLTELPEQWK